ncbi:MAG: fused MFS/spermidine synthase [Nocardioides sp.]|uniref:spermidine synthase n=1 Tax=Nocardioides sp. TaxID=35761 RepID=UPI0039E450EF
MPDAAVSSTGPTTARTVEIRAGDRPGAYLIRFDGRDQSYVDLGDPTRLVFDYVRWLGDLIDVHGPAGEPRRVVHVGGAGLTLPRYVAATRPRSTQTVFEPDAALTDLVRRELPLPRASGIRVRPTDGRTGLATLRDESVDLLIVDAFAEARVPSSLVSIEAFAEMARVLRPGGILAANLTDHAPFRHTRHTLAGLRAALPELALLAEPATLRGRRPGNLVALAADAGLPLAALRTRTTRSAAPYRLLDGRAVSDSFGGGRAFADADAEPGPVDRLSG